MYCMRAAMVVFLNASKADQTIMDRFVIAAHSPRMAVFAADIRIITEIPALIAMGNFRQVIINSAKSIFGYSGPGYVPGVWRLFQPLRIGLLLVLRHTLNLLHSIVEVGGFARLLNQSLLMKLIILPLGMFDSHLMRYFSSMVQNVAIIKIQECIELDDPIGHMHWDASHCLPLSKDQILLN